MALYEKVDALGEAILQWADPENQYRGYTEVGFHLIQWFSSSFWY